MIRRFLCSISILAICAIFVTCKDPSVANNQPDGGNKTPYTVRFDKNHNDVSGWTGANPVSKTVVSPAATVDTLPIPPTRTDYTFTGWNTKQDGSGAKFTADTAVTADITVYAQWKSGNGSEIFTINLSITGNDGGDSVEVSPASAENGDTITISYTLADVNNNNRLAFSGTGESIEPANEAGTGIREYTVDENDANGNGIITINAAFTHTDKNIDTIAFEDTASVHKTYGDAPFTRAVTNSGAGSGAITYSSSEPGVATVNASGQVTIHKAGDTTITAAKAADANYEGTTAYYTLHIATATGAAVSAPTELSKTSTSITVNAVTAPSTGQTVEYAISTSTTAPSSGWQSGTQFTGLTANTNYYVFARAASNTNYEAGIAAMSAQITTSTGGTPVVTQVIVDFETDNTGSTTKYTSTKGGSNPTISIVSSPAQGTRALQVVVGGYNQAAVIPITLPYALSSWATVTLKFNKSAGTLDDTTLRVYAGSGTAAFKDNAFGNAAGNSGNYPEFANLLVGTATVTNTNGTWQSLSINIGTPGSSIAGLKNTVYLAIGINQSASLTYQLDDITFTIKDNFEPPPAPIPLNPPSVGAVTSGNYRNMLAEWGQKSTTEINTKVTSTYSKLFNGTADQKIYYEVNGDEAYILDSGNNDVRSEGMSYGMMMAVQMNDKDRFDKLWRWAYNHMYYPSGTARTGDNRRGFFAWQVGTNGNVMDGGSAPDGEFYFVTALLFAQNRWGNGTGVLEYGKHARQVLYDMLNRKGADPNRMDTYGAIPMFNPTHNVPEFTNITAQHTDPSYILPAFYDVWAMEIRADTSYHTSIWGSTANANAAAARYEELATAGRAFFPKTVNATTGLGPDYAQYSGAPGSHGDFEYDAWRIAMNIAMDYHWFAKDPWQITQTDRLMTFFQSQGVSSYGNRYSLSGNKLGSDHSPGLVGCNAAASLAATHERVWEFIEDFWNISMTEGRYRYYDGCLYMLGLLHVSGNFKAYLSSGGS